MRIQGALLLATRKAHVLVPQVDLRSYAGCSEMDGQTLVLGVIGPQLHSKKPPSGVCSADDYERKNKDNGHPPKQAPADADR